MAKKRAWLPIVGGIAVLLVFVIIAGLFVAVSVVRDRVEIDTTQTEATVGDEFDRVRRQFPNQTPMLVFDGETPRLSEAAKAGTSAAALENLHVLAWDPRDGELARFSLPFWLMRLQAKPFRVGDMVSTFENRSLEITVEDIERFGPGMLLDYADSRGARVIVWVQ